PRGDGGRGRLLARQASPICPGEDLLAGHLVRRRPDAAEEVEQHPRIADRSTGRPAAALLFGKERLKCLLPGGCVLVGLGEVLDVWHVRLLPGHTLPYTISE